MRKVKSQWVIINSQWKRILLLAFTFYISLCTSFAQKITATVDRDKILIGEQITLTVQAEDMDATKSLYQWFNVADTFNHFEIVHRSAIDTVKIDNDIKYIQKITLTSFDSGYWQIPKLTIALTNHQQISSDIINITVLPVDVSGLKDYHDIKDIIEVEKETNWLLIGLITAGAMMAAALIYLLIRYFKRRKSSTPKPIKNRGLKEAMAALEKLEHKNLIQLNQHKLFFTELILICKDFTDSVLQLNSIDKTTDEYMLQLKNKITNETVETKYFQLLRLSDAIKFAKLIPATNECSNAITVAKDFIQQAYQNKFNAQ